MADEVAEVITTETPATPEVVVETPEAPTPPPTDEVVVETPAVEESPTEAEATPEIADTVSVPDITFAPDEALPAVLEKADAVLDKYELPPDVQAVVTELRTRAEAPQDNFVEYAEYGDTDAVRSLLDEHSLIYTANTDENGNIRPNTDKFALSVAQKDPEKAQWLYYDLAQLPSQKYPGLNQFEEGIADNLSKEGDTVATVMTRYRQAIDTIKSGASFTSDVPSFIPANLKEAYWAQSKADRDEIDQFAPENDRIELDDNGRAINLDEAVRQRKLNTLAQVQKGIDGDKVIAQNAAQQKQYAQQSFNQDVVTTQNQFYDTFRDSFTKDLIKDVKFSTDPKMQTILAYQNVALLTQAFSPDNDGVFARQALTEAGIQFDEAKAQKLVQDIEAASVALNTAKRQVDQNGKMLNPIEYNKATKSFERAGREWQSFAKHIIDQQAKLTSTGKAEELKAEVAKQKVPLKARPTTQGAPEPATKKEQIPMRGTPEWKTYWADKAMAEEAARGNPAYAR